MRGATACSDLRAREERWQTKKRDGEHSTGTGRAPPRQGALFPDPPSTDWDRNRASLASIDLLRARARRGGLARVDRGVLSPSPSSRAHGALPIRHADGGARRAENPRRQRMEFVFHSDARSGCRVMWYGGPLLYIWKLFAPVLRGAAWSEKRGKSAAGRGWARRRIGKKTTGRTRKKSRGMNQKRTAEEDGKGGGGGGGGRVGS